MKLLIDKQTPALPQYSVGDIVIRGNKESDPIQLNIGTKIGREYYYGSFLSGHGRIGSSDPNSKYHYSTMDELIEAIEKYGKITQHYSKSHYALKIVPIGGE